MKFIRGVINVAIKILYCGHKGEHREYFICSYCGTAFCDDTFTTTAGPNEALCPVCCNLVKEVDESVMNEYLSKFFGKVIL
jgi:hypothetical protein